MEPIVIGYLGTKPIQIEDVTISLSEAKVIVKVGYEKKTISVLALYQNCSWVVPRIQRINSRISFCIVNYLNTHFI